MFQNFIFMIILIFSLLLSISSNNWFGIWMGLEINLIMFISIIIKNKFLYSSESAIIYFIFQAFASLIFFNFMIMLLYLNFFNLNMFTFMIMSSLLMKLGSAPFHYWLPLIMENMSWFKNFILMTFQKIIPMILISYLMNLNYLLFFILICGFISFLGGLNQTSIRKLMAFSSINQISWFLMSMMINELMFKFYFLIYFILLINIILMLNMFNLFWINQLFFFNFKKNNLKLLLFFNFMSMGGLPPFIGFFYKLIIIKEILIMNNFILIFFMIIFSLIILFYYIRLMYNCFLFNNMLIKFLMNNLNLNYLLFFSFLNNFLLMFLYFIFF